jgi:hypothetical protein
MADKVIRKPLARLRDNIESKGGIAEVPMWELRDHAGWDRLGVNVVKDIASKMRRGGLATLPALGSLPISRHAIIRIYVTDSRVGDVIRAVVEPSSKGDDLLREIGGDDASDVLKAVRELVCG